MTTAPSPWLTEAFQADPYPHYAAMRASAPVHFDEFRRSWMLMRYADIDRALRDSARFSAEQGGTPNSMLVTDPPRHTRLRGLVSKAFTPSTVRRLRPRIVAIVDDLLDAAAERATIDAIADFAYPLPITVIAELLGVDAEDRFFFREQSQKIALAIGPSADPYAGARAGEGRGRLLAYFDDLIARRRAEPRDDLVSAMVRAEERGDLLSHGELMAMLILLLVGGHETTVNLIGNGLLALLRHPDQLARLRTQAGIERTAVDELLRYDSPVQYTGRVAAEDVEIGGERIRKGERVRMVLASGNRDPEAFEDPDRLDLTRDAYHHLSFGMGVHYCLGAELARVEGEIALPAIVRRFPRVRLAAVTETLRWRPASVMRGLEALPLALGR
jgi:cytochrome P450